MRSRKKALRRTTVFVAAVVCAVGLMAGTALAAVTTIGAIKAAPTAGEQVTLTGTISKAVEGNEYILDDGTGTITIECGPTWYKSVALALGATVTITGEVDLGKDGTGAVEIDTQTIDNGGQITTVRPASGPPPWAGGPHKSGLKPGGGNAVDDDPDGTTPDAD